MIDIVFLLISFFTLVLNFSQSEQHEQVTLPKSELAQPPDSMPSEPMTLQITDREEIYLGLTRCYLDSTGQNNTTDSNAWGRPFSKVLKEELHISAIISQVEPKDITVIIRADENIRGIFIKRLIQTCQGQGMENFILRARQAAQDEE